MLATSALGGGCGLLIGLDSYEVEPSDDDDDDPVPCDTGADCDDDNECTTESCEEGECAFLAVTAGTECDGGVCNGSTGSPACARCIDDVGGEGQDTGCPAGAPQCRIDGEAVCVGCRSGNDCDDGNDCNVDTCTEGECHYSGACGGDTPICDDGECVECLTNNDCDDDIDCSEEACRNGVCVRDYQDDECEQSEELCTRTECTATGCVDVNLGIASTTELLVDGDLEVGTGWSEATDPDDRDIITTPAIGSAQSGTNIGLMTTGIAASEYAFLFRDVEIPTGIDALRASGHFWTPTIDPPSEIGGDPEYDYIGVGFWSGTAWYEVHYFSNDNPVANSWTPFEQFFDLTLVPNGTIEFNAIGEADGVSPHVTYYIDNLSLEAITCND